MVAVKQLPPETIIELNRWIIRRVKAATRPKQQPPTCHCYAGGNVERVTNYQVDADDGDLTPHMEGTRWLFTGWRCGCGRRFNGTYRSVEK